MPKVKDLRVRVAEIDVDVLSIGGKVVGSSLIGHVINPMLMEPEKLVHVGLAFEFEGKEFLEDAFLKHSELSFFDQDNVIPMMIWVYLDPILRPSLRLFLHERIIVKITEGRLKRDWVEQVLEKESVLMDLEVIRDGDNSN